MKTITMYELLGMVKDGKAPEIIKYANYIWTYKKCVSDYTNDSEYLFADVMSNVDDTAIFLNDTVEILEEKKIPEKIEIYEDSEGHYFIDNHCKKIYITCDEVNFMIEEFNQLIDYLKSKGDE